MTAILDGVDSNHGYVCVFLLLNCLGGIVVFKALKSKEGFSQMFVMNSVTASNVA